MEFLRVNGQLRAPREGETMTLPDGRTRTWATIKANKNDAFEGAAARGGYVYLTCAAESPRIMMLEAVGHSMAFVNGSPQPGDVYGYGYVRVPVALHTGANEFLFASGRGSLKAKLTPPPSPIFFNLGDPTLPDLVVDEKTDTWAAVVLVNATTNWFRGYDIIAMLGTHKSRTPAPTIPPLSVRKIGFRITGPKSGKPGVTPVQLAVVPEGKSAGSAVATAKIELRIRKPEQTQKRTFVSEIDGSVQYYAVSPASAPPPPGEHHALFLTLHGASVEAIGQADAYYPKRWGVFAAPTNRRPYGFDWEDWGRLDALEVLDLAIQRYQPDPSRIYLTGHSMGGHGTWNIGAHFAGRFAAIGPSAGWISFSSYGQATVITNSTPIRQLMSRASSTSDTIGVSTNYLQLGVYVLHGDADDNVPVSEARNMRKHLSNFHNDVSWHEQPGAGHWWGNSDEPGSACVDWPPMFDFFARHRRPDPASVRQVNFTTFNPGVSSRDQWLEIESQEHPLTASRAEIQYDPGKQRFIGKTENIAKMALDVSFLKTNESVVLDLDGNKFTNAALPRLWLAKQNGQWHVASAPSPLEKGPLRNGPFKDAFRHRMIFVYGTHGDAEENAWALAKARYDAESFWYRGNGSIDIVPDTAFDPSREPNRGVILYGHREMNSAWNSLLGDSPVQVSRNLVSIGNRKLEGSDQTCLFLRPRPGSDIACVGVVAGTGLPGLRLTDRLPYFMAGLGYPDCVVIGAEAPRKGLDGIRAAGFFGNDWSVESGDFAWRD